MFHTSFLLAWMGLRHLQKCTVNPSNLSSWGRVVCSAPVCFLWTDPFVSAPALVSFFWFSNGNLHFWWWWQSKSLDFWERSIRKLLLNGMPFAPSAAQQGRMEQQVRAWPGEAEPAGLLQAPVARKMALPIMARLALSLKAAQGNASYSGVACLSLT